MPVPNGYREVDMGPLTIKVLTCKKCGALVVMHRTHDDYHKKRGE